MIIKIMMPSKTCQRITSCFYIFKLIGQKIAEIYVKNTNSYNFHPYSGPLCNHMALHTELAFDAYYSTEDFSSLFINTSEEKVNIPDIFVSFIH